MIGTRFLLVLALPLTLLATTARANFSVDEVVQGTQEGLKLFKTTEHAEHFVGFKAWKSGEEMKLKVYANHDGAPVEVNYMCHKHDDGLECHAQ